MKQTYINFKDCYADIANDMKVYPHELNYSPKYQINMTYREMENSIYSGSIDLIHRFLDKALPEVEEQQQFLEGIGLLLTPDPTYYEPLYIFGSDTKGMRVLFSLIGSAIGLNNVSTLTMAELIRIHDSKMPRRLDNKLVNITFWKDSCNEIIIPTAPKLIFISNNKPEVPPISEEGYELFNYVYLEDMPQLRDPKFLQEFIKALPCLFYLATNEAKDIYNMENEAAYEEAEAKRWNSIKLPDGNTLELII
jgi:hypothetical protein